VIVRRRIIILAIMWLVVGVRFAQAARADGAASRPDPDSRGDALVAQLGDPDPALRQQAEDRLMDMGIDAREALLRGTQSTMPAIADRSRQILQDLPWYLPEDPPFVRRLLTDYGSKQPASRMEVARQLFGLQQGEGFNALLRLMVEDSDRQVEWCIEQTFRDNSARLSPRQTERLVLATDKPAALCLAAWSMEPSDFGRAIELYELAVRSVNESDEPCLAQLAPTFDRLIGFHQFRQEYEKSAELLRMKWTMSRRELEIGGPAPTALDDLFALHAEHGPLAGFAGDLRTNADQLLRPHVIYALGKLCEKRNDFFAASILYHLAYAMSSFSPELREGVSEFLLEQHWSTLAERELEAITQSWFTPAQMADGARMRLGLLYSSLGDDKNASQYLAQALPGLHNRSVWIALQHGDHHLYGRGAENYLWTVQHYHALRFAKSQHDEPEADRQALAIAKLAPEEPTFALVAVPVLQANHHTKEANDLFNKAYAAAHRALDEAPDNPLRLNNVAWLCAICDEKLDEALSLALRAEKLDADDPNLADTVAEIQFRKGNVDDAIEQINRAIQLDPKSDYFKAQLKRFESAPVNAK
jgi:tetratricopeptide (TPR) repeat protein